MAMSLTLHQKRKNLYGGLTILLAIIIASLAWAQIVTGLSQCLSPFK
jgi:UDP-N-acetylmuramyl pentapeptide phosphotransferase/UDP-N-acetylglucosamine-1-phosphate transferase